jgi:hypothetical protein
MRFAFGALPSASGGALTSRPVIEQEVRARLNEKPDYWAHSIYYGPNCNWWVPGEALVPLPPP